MRRKRRTTITRMTKILRIAQLEVGTAMATTRLRISLRMLRIRKMASFSSPFLP